uniref:SANT domain-containing protein n=1 Tax=Bombyx mori TaxID=7091 RepID=A0A8R2R1I9_BOMMO|nr:protein cramped isoform X3 [Bombyx mori]
MSTMPNKDNIRTPTTEVKPSINPVLQVVTAKSTMVPIKVVPKAMKETPMSPPSMSPADTERTELLGSLTTQQQQRTSARVIKKLKLEPQGDKRVAKRSEGASDDITECETPNKIDDKDALKFPTVKQRMPKALWSTDEKNLFFEALNEYGKDFDAITAYIRGKIKKKGMPEANMKTKTQVSHFYYRTWHKLSKHVRFDENVKKVAQELYALINYGELRKKLVSVSEKTCGRLDELVRRGGLAVRARGRTLRVRTPMCPALRALNHITERSCSSRVCSRACVSLRARDAGAWGRVQAAAHNPRLALALPPRVSLRALLRALHARWKGTTSYKHRVSESADTKGSEELCRDTDEYPALTQGCPEDKDDEKEEDGHHLGLETDRVIVHEQRQVKKLALHLGPRPDAEIHIPVVSPSEQLSSQKICFSSYLERMGKLRRDKDGVGAKIRTPKRLRKDSATERELDTKKYKTDDNEKLINIDETAIDGVELMASYRHHLDDEEKPSTEDEKEAPEEYADREKDMSEREKDSLSELEDDDKYNKSDTDNDSDPGRADRKEQKLNNLKVDDGMKVDEEIKPQIDVDTALKQIRRGWSIHDAGDLTIGDLYLMFGSRSKIELDYWWAVPTPPLPGPPSIEKKDKPEAPCADRKDRTPDKGDSSVEDEGKRESDNDIFSPKNTYSQDSNDGASGDERKGEQTLSPEHKWSGSLKLVSKLLNRPTPAASVSQNGFALLSERLKRLLSMAGNPAVPPPPAAACRCRPPAPKPPPRAPPGPVFRPPAPSPVPPPARPASQEGVPLWRRRPPAANKRVVVQRLLPLLPKLPQHTDLIPVEMVPGPAAAAPKILPKPPVLTEQKTNGPQFYVLSESEGQFYVHDGGRRIPLTAADCNNKDEYDENGLSTESINSEEATEPSACPQEKSAAEDERDPGAGDQKLEASMESLLPSESMSLSPSRLLREAEGWLEGSVHDFSLSSFLGHLEGNRPPELANQLSVTRITRGTGRRVPASACSNACPLLFQPAPPASPRRPVPIAPRPDSEAPPPLSLEGLPPWRRRTPAPNKRVVVQRLLPLLPKLPSHTDLNPAKVSPSPAPAPPKLLPRPPAADTARDGPQFYVLSELEGQFYVHDGGRRIPLTTTTSAERRDESDEVNVKKEETESVSEPSTCPPEQSPGEDEGQPAGADQKRDADLGSFLPSESMSLSPSRLLREAEGWLEGSVHDFSLSSFLGHLDGNRPPELAVDSQLHSLMAESSVDYVAKFADLAAEVNALAPGLDGRDAPRPADLK